MLVIEAYRQGQRDREQGWPDMSYYWQFPTDLCLRAYLFGYSNPRGI